MKLNPRWLYAAVVYDANGARFGTICEVKEDDDTVLIGSKGDFYTSSASLLDKLGLLEKTNAVHRKYLKD